MIKAFICIPAVIVFIFFSCTTAQILQDTPPGNFTFDVTVKNNTQFDLEILDDTKIIPRHGEKKITLPIFFGELNDGYPVKYRVRLLDDIFISIPRNENIIIKNDQHIAIIESPDFQSDLSFLVLKNDGKQTLSLKDDDGYFNALVRANPREYNSSPYMGPGNSYVYELKTGQNKLSIETDQYRTIAFLNNSITPGYVYAFIFDGNEVLPVDARPLLEIGSPAPMAVEFTGDDLPETEQRQIIETLRAALLANEVLLHPLVPEEYALYEGRVFYTMQVALHTSVQPPSWPANTELITGNLTLTVLRSGKELRSSETRNLREMYRDGVLLKVSDFVKDRKDFYQGIKADMSF